jgi:signal peptidase I
MYLLNPLGVHSWDPRGRILGVIPYRVPAESMAPTLKSNDYVLACTGAYRNAPPKVGDVVVFWTPPEFKVPYVKRVVAVAGDTVELRGNEFLRNGIPQAEPYVSPEHDYDEQAPTQIPEGFLFVMGDNREHSMDSRHFGPIPTNQIIGEICKQF